MVSLLWQNSTAVNEGKVRLKRKYSGGSFFLPVPRSASSQWFCLLIIIPQLILSSEEVLDHDDMTSMDQILDVNHRKETVNYTELFRCKFFSALQKKTFSSGLRAPRGMSIRDGDIAVSYLRSAINCPGNACLWPKSVDGFVYVPYILSPLYGRMA